MKHIAILVVNGGDDPKYGQWLPLCIQKILSLTSYENFTVYVWNNNVQDKELEADLKNLKKVRLFSANPEEQLAHFHAVPLQRLYEVALKDGADYIVIMDSDAHPLHKEWLAELVGSLNKDVVLSGVLRDELKTAIPPYIHASCLCTTPEYIQRCGKPLDYFSANSDEVKHDTLSFLSEYAVQHKLKWYGLKRTNYRNFHRLIGGVYGNLIYHHGAGSRRRITFWDEKDKSEARILLNGKLATQSANLLFKFYSEYIDWLTGASSSKQFVKKLLCNRQLKRLKALNVCFLKK